MVWSDDDLSLGSTHSSVEGEEEGQEEFASTGGDNLMEGEEDYIPDSLRDFIAEADAALEECLSSERFSESLLGGGGIDANTDNNTTAVIGDECNGGVAPPTAASTSSTVTSTVTATATATIVPDDVGGTENDPAHLNRNNNDIHNDTSTRNSSFFSPASDVQGGPFDTDIGSGCRPNPVNHYGTDSAVKRIALNDDPGLCPDHGDSCICHLKVERRLEDFLLAANGNGNRNEASQCMEVVGGQGQQQMDFGNGYGVLARDMVADDSFSSPVVSKQLVYDGSSGEEKAVPLDNQQVDVDMMTMMMDVDEAATNEKTVPLSVSNNGGGTVVDNNSDDIDDETFLPNGQNEAFTTATVTTENEHFDDAFLPNSDSLDIPHCDTMKKSNVSVGVSAAAKTKVRTTNVSNKTVAIKKQKRIVKPGIMASIEKKKLTTTAAKAKQTATSTTKGGRRVRTVPKSPALNTKKLRGERRYSGVGGVRSKLVPSTSSAGNENTNRINKNNSGSATIAMTQKLHGDRQSSAVGFRDEKKEMDHTAAANHTNNGPTKIVDYKNKALTVPKSPNLISSAKLGNRKYSVVGTREVKETKEAPQADLDYKNKALTVPKSPNLISRAKLGDRKYSGVGARREEKMEAIDENRPKIDYKNKGLTVPKAPKLISSEKLGDRRYSTVGMREGKMEEIKEEEVPKINYKTKALTVPKAPTLSTAARPQREKKKKDESAGEKEKYEFKALPIMSGVLEQKPLGVRKVQKKAPTVPKPFRLQTDERIPDNKPQRTKKEEKSTQSTTFRARPVPDFSRLQSTMQRSRVSKKTTPQPFQLKTEEIALSPRRVRISNASESLKKSSSSTTQAPKKRVITTPKPFNFTQVVRVSSPSRERVAPSTKAFSYDRIKSPKPPTTPKPFNFSSPPKRSPKPVVPTDLAHFMSPTKKRKVTVPKPFRLSTSRPSKLPTPPTTKVESKKATRKVVKPPPPPPRVKRKPTKLRPFNLSTTNSSKIKSPENKGAVNKPRPTATSDTMNGNSKDDCPIAFRRKLLLRSTRSNSGADRDEQAKIVVNQLEELSALVQQAVI